MTRSAKYLTILPVAILTIVATAILCVGTVHADQAKGRVVKSVVNNPTTVIVPPTPPTPPAPTQTITGSGKPNSTITITDNGSVVATTQTDGQGTYSVPVPLVLGKNRLQAIGDYGSSQTITLTRQPAWWSRWGNVLTALAGLSVILLIIGLIIKLSAVELF